MLKKLAIAALGLISMFGCQNDESSSTASIRWADSVLAYSTQYDTVEWSAHMALGAPDTYPNYGDIVTAWTSEDRDFQREYLELGYFSSPGPIRSMAIFETYNPGFVDTVYVKNPNSGAWEIVYQDSAFDYGDSSRIFIINFPETSYDVTAIRIAMDEFKIKGWNEIDAVGISSETLPAETDTDFWNAYITTPASKSKKSVKPLR